MKYKIYDIDKDYITGSKWLWKSPKLQSYICVDYIEVLLDDSKFRRTKGRKVLYEVVGKINNVLLCYKASYKEITRKIEDKLNAIDSKEEE